VYPPYHPHQPLKANGRTNRSTYALKVQAGFVTALLVVVGLLRAPIFGDNGVFNIVLDQQEVIKMEDIVQTRQDLPPPPPPRPPVPIAVPNDEIIEDDELNLDVTLDISDAVADLPPPPPEAEVEEEELPFFVVVEEMPEMIGGLEALNKAVNYPAIAIKAGVQGRVTVQYIVDENGNVTDAVVLRGIGAGCDEEALRVIRLMKFVPGRQRGQAVKVKMASVVNFRLN
jgi:protein TonB